MKISLKQKITEMGKMSFSLRLKTKPSSVGEERTL
jgi:hypothetical protein